MRAPRHSDELFEFSYRHFKIEYKIIKLVLVALSLYGLYQFVTVHLGIHLSFGSTPTTASSTSASAPATPP
jgi:hypothetical protein